LAAQDRAGTHLQIWDMLFRSKSPVSPEPGQKFRSAPTAGAIHPKMVWTVDEVHSASDGRAYAVLVNGADSSRRKGVAVGALLDPTLYRPIRA
jgi:hypothetical protein